MLKKGTQHGRRNGDKFNDILSFRRKWQTAFGLRLRGRIRVGVPCFDTLGLHRGVQARKMTAAVWVKVG